MRPVARGKSPLAVDFKHYDDAKPELVSRLGRYCSYCERPIATLLAVEHIQPKDLSAYSHLERRWENFLLACVNCNSMKSNKDVLLENILLPDRDNTFAAFDYPPDGRVMPSAAVIAAGLETRAQATLALTGLDKKIAVILDANGKQVALDRVAQRLEVWGTANEAYTDVQENPDLDVVRRQVTNLASASGFFSIWITVFKNDADMRQRLIDAFAGTRASQCFDAVTGIAVTPAPNPDQLPDGSKF